MSLSFRIDWFDLLAVRGTVKSLLQYHSLKASVLCPSAFSMVQLSHPCILFLFSNSVMSNSLWPHVFAAHQASLSFTISGSLSKLMSIELVMPFSHLILCHPLLLLPSIFPNIRVLSNELALCIRWPKYWSSMTAGNTITLTIQIFVSKIMSLLFNMLSSFITTFLPRSKCLLITCLYSLSAVILELQKIKSVTVSTVSPSICHEVMGLDAMIFVFWMLSFKPAFSLSSFTFIKRLFSFSLLSAIRVVSSAYLRLLIFLPQILIPAFTNVVVKCWGKGRYSMFFRLDLSL